MRTVNMHEAKSALSRLVEAVESGAEKEIIIARNGRPVAKLVPAPTKARTARPLGLLDGKFPPISLEEFDRENERIAASFRSEE